MAGSFVAGFALLIGAASGAAGQEIDTRTGAGGEGQITVGEYDRPADGSSGGTRYLYGIGQTFVTPDAGATRLDQFTFWLGAHPSSYNPADLVFRAYLLEWNPLTNRPNSVLWESGNTSGTGGGAGYQDPFATQEVVQRSFSPGITLDPTMVYLALLSSVETPGAHLAGQHTLNFSRFVTGSSYTGGSLISASTPYASIGATESALLSLVDIAGSTNYSVHSAYDADFQASFSAVDATVTPEPATLALLGSGLAGVAAARRRRKKDPEPPA